MKTSIKHPLWLALASILLGASPLLPVAGASLVAEWKGCALDEGNIHPCIILGMDFGEVLYSLGVMGWFLLLSVPLGAMGLCVAIIWLVVVLIKKGIDKKTRGRKVTTL